MTLLLLLIDDDDDDDKRTVAVLDDKYRGIHFITNHKRQLNWYYFLFI